jgi:DNA-binding XRE family transcriptional regulator
MRKNYFDDVIYTTQQITENKKMSLGPWVTEYRNQLGLTIKQFAEKIGCAYQTLQNIEKEYNYHFKGIDEYGPYHPGEKLMTSIAAEFNKTLEDVFKETNYQDKSIRKVGFGHKQPNKKKKSKKLIERTHSKIVETCKPLEPKKTLENITTVKDILEKREELLEKIKECNSLITKYQCKQTTLKIELDNLEQLEIKNG